LKSTFRRICSATRNGYRTGEIEPDTGKRLADLIQNFGGGVKDIISPHVSAATLGKLNDLLGLIGSAEWMVRVSKYDEFDNAALTMLNHPTESWEHALFKDVVSKVANLDICYRAVQFYLAEHPLLTNDLLGAVAARVDHARVVGIARRMNHLPLIRAYLIAVQEKNVGAVNEALNELYIEEEDFESLRNSIDHFDAFDNIILAQKLEKA